MRPAMRALGAVGLVGAALAVWGARTAHLGGPPRPDAGAAAPAGGPAAIVALGRLEPQGGVRRLAGPSRPTLVIDRLLVEEGDLVEAAQPLAVLDTLAEDRARVARLSAELTNARSELERAEGLVRAGSTSPAQRDAARLKADAAAAELDGARAALEADTVRAPVPGRILKVHARSGERVGPAGIVELGQTDRMYAVAEVYETDVGGVRVGQRATIRSRTLPGAVHGTVERVGLLVRQLDVLGTDPAADADARVVEVRVRLDDAPPAALTNLQVEVAIEPDGAGTPASP